jgi:hypothetical protein
LLRGKGALERYCGSIIVVDDEIDHPKARRSLRNSEQRCDDRCRPKDRIRNKRTF